MEILFNPIDPAFLEDPYPTYQRLRDEAPIYRHPGGFQAVSRHEDVVAVLKDPARFSSVAMGGGNPLPGQQRGGPIQGSLIGQDPPVHTQQRNTVNRGFTPRRISALEPRIQQLVNDLFAEFEHRGSCDLTQELAAPLPVTVIAELLGLDADRWDDFKRWSNAMIVGGTSPTARISGDETRKSVREFAAYLSSVIEQRRKSPGDDLISILIHAGEDAGVLSPEQVLAFASLLLIAGSETTMNLIGNTTFALLQHREQLEAVRNDRSLIAGALEETLRWDSPVQLLARLATGPAELPSGKVEQGMVMILLGAANRDERQFPNADRFDIRRNTTGHLGFGLGNHFCLGASLARLEARLAMEAVIDRLPQLRLGEGIIERHGSFLVRGPKALPLAFDACPAA